ncbi:MAG: hypothetical protein WA971_15215 [Microbacterium sp.]
MTDDPNQQPYGAMPPAPPTNPVPPQPEQAQYPAYPPVPQPDQFGGPAQAGYPGQSVPSPYAPPPGAYGAPIGGYAAPAGAYAPAPAPRSSKIGVIALVLSLVAFVVAPILSIVFGVQIGQHAPGFIDQAENGGATDLSALAGARTQVLWAELAFWLGTIAGIAAIVTGIIAIVKRSGRGQGIAAIVLAAIAPVVFFFAVSIGIGVGAAMVMG